MRILALLLLSASPALAEGKLLSVLELRNKLEAADRKAVDAAYLSDRIRAEVLDAKLGVQVMTRENMLVLLQAQGKSLDNCEGECEVDTGRRLGADYVISGEVLRVGSQLKASLKLHDTRTGMLLGAISASGVDVDALDGSLPAAVHKLTASLPRGAEAPGTQPPPASAQPAPAAAPPPRPASIISMKVESPPEGRWLLVASDGSLVCQLPCTQRLDRDAVYYAELDADRTEDRHRVQLPPGASFAAGRSAEAHYVSGRETKGAGMALAVVGLAAGAWGFGALQSSPGDTLSKGLLAGGAAGAVLGVVLIAISRSEHYEGIVAPGLTALRMTPGGLALAF